MGAAVGNLLVPAEDGAADGAAEGASVDGPAVGDAVGVSVGSHGKRVSPVFFSNWAFILRQLLVGVDLRWHFLALQ